MEAAQRAICTLGQGQGFVDGFWCRENGGSRLRHTRIDSIHTFVRKPPTGRGKLLGTPKSIFSLRTLMNHPLRVCTKYCFRGVSDASEVAVGYVGSPPGGDAWKGREGNTEQTYTVEVYVMLSSTQLPHVLSSMITYNPALYDQGKALLETNISVC
ncbi:uncharacterized protein B0T23DRAFT_307605 [Neurospora hispaniola]|uniref:Uncharacterized protein n=1 Tax=Neurospora hispaniola TaxID=588809 RepID=A0AAJ0IGK2_9PEZI|nr:hypothetical protein B0T23DRAFT_307605 [Neurospora hispaniola]